MNERATSVLVVDDQELIREGIASLLSLQERITVVGTAADGLQAVEAAAELMPDVVLMDVRMPVMDGVAAVRQLRRRSLPCRIVMLTTFDDEEYVIEALRAGASGYLLKDLPIENLTESIRLAAAGVALFDRTVLSGVAEALGGGPGSGVPPGPASRPAFGGLGEAAADARQVLTRRELDVLDLVAQGYTNRQIAGRLFVSEGTVKNHVSRVLARLGLRDRTQAVMYARDRGLL